MASKTAFAPRGKLELASVIKRDLWEIGYKKSAPQGPASGKFATPPKGMSFGIGVLLGGLLIALFAWFKRRKA